MKKLLALLLSLATLLNFAACTGKSPAAPSESASVPSKNESEPDSTEDSAASKEIVVVDNEECLIKLTSIGPDGTWGYTLKTHFENKSSEKNYMFSVESAAINGVQVDPFGTTVDAGGKADIDTSFTQDELEEIGIEECTDIELYFRVYDSDDWFAEDVFQKTIHIYPNGE